jgi:hypothetical protein
MMRNFPTRSRYSGGLRPRSFLMSAFGRFPDVCAHRASAIRFLATGGRCSRSRSALGVTTSFLGTSRDAYAEPGANFLERFRVSHLVFARGLLVGLGLNLRRGSMQHPQLVAVLEGTDERGHPVEVGLG